MKIDKRDDFIVVKWQFSKTAIPISEIIDVSYDDTFAGKSKTAVRIGYSYGTTDRVLIKTKKKDYIIFTSIGGIQEKILAFLK